MPDPTTSPSGAKRGKPRLTVAVVEPLIERFLGNLAGIAAALKVSRQAVHQFIGEHPRLRGLVDAEKERIKDLVERSLVRKAIGDQNNEPEAWAVCFYLKTQAKDRGYIERQELTGKDGESLTQPVKEIVIEHHSAGPANPPAEQSAISGDAGAEADRPDAPGPDAGLELHE